jgi:hypothetical protein
MGRAIQRILLPALLCVALACAKATVSPEAEARVSPLSYRAVVPARWLVMGRHELVGLESELESATLSGLAPDAPRELSAHVIETIRSGQLEFFLLDPQLEGSYANLNVVPSASGLPPVGTNMRRFCDQIGETFASGVGRFISLDRCDLERIGPHIALVIESEGAIEGSRCIQIGLGRSRTDGLTFSATVEREAVDRYRPEIRAFIESITFVDPR